MSNGRMYRITLDHRPTNSEAVKLMAKEINRMPVSASNMTFDDAAKVYIASKSNVLSPATIRGYNIILRNLPADFLTTHIYDITSMTVQTNVNNLVGMGKSPKTIRNYSSFIITVLKSAEIDVKPPTLPQKEKKSPYIPSAGDIKKLFEAVKGTDIEAAIILATLSLRRSEIAALTPDDIKGNVLTVNKALVPGADGKWVLKATKTTDSTRDIIIPQELADLIKERGYIYNKMPDSLNDDLYRAQDAAGVPRFSLHKLRHFFASYMHDQGFSDKQIQEMGGWKTDSIMKTVYQHAMEMDKAKQDMVCAIDRLRG